MCYNPEFERLRQFGEQYELIFKDIIERKLNNCVATKIKGNVKEFDFHLQWTTRDGRDKTMFVEVKADKKTTETGNIVIEYEGYGKPSGISTTLASRWIYFIVGTPTYYIIPVSWIKQAIADGLYFWDGCGGDRKATRMYLFSLKDIPEQFRFSY